MPAQSVDPSLAPAAAKLGGRPISSTSALGSGTAGVRAPNHHRLASTGIDPISDRSGSADPRGLSMSLPTCGHLVKRYVLGDRKLSCSKCANGPKATFCEKCGWRREVMPPL